MAGKEKSFDRKVLPLVGADHALGPLRRMGRFEWEKVMTRCTFNPSSVKLVALSAALYATPSTGANVRPGVALLAGITGLGDRQVRRNLKTLEQAGALFMVASGSSYGRGGAGAASEYHLTFPETLAEQFEIEWNADEWKPLDQWDVTKTIEHYAGITGHGSPVDKSDHRTPESGDSGVLPKALPQNRDLSPDMGDISPDMGDKNTGHQDPPKTPRPLHLTSHHQSGSVTLGDAHKKKTDEKSFAQIGDDPEWEQTYAAASQHLQNLPDHGQAAMDQSSKRSPMAPIVERVLNAATASGWRTTGVRDAS